MIWYVSLSSTFSDDSGLRAHVDKALLAVACIHSRAQERPETQNHNVVRLCFDGGSWSPRVGFKLRHVAVDPITTRPQLQHHSRASS